MKDNKIKKNGVIRENLDTDIDPRTDFFQYACGGWMKANPLTPEYARYGMFDKIRENNRLRLRELVETLSSHPDSKIKDTVAQKVSTLFSQGMDTETLDKQGATPLLPLRARIAKTTKENLEEETAWLHSATTPTFFTTGVGPSPTDSNLNIMHLGEVGLSLGDRDYYLVDSESNRKILEAWETYVKRIMNLCGYGQEEAERIWTTVSDLEHKFAEHKMTREDRRNPMLRLNPMTLAEIENRWPSFGWKRYFTALGVNPEKLGTMNVSNPAFYDFLNNLLPSLSEQEIRDYAEYCAVSASTGLLGKDFTDADFDLYDRVMSGKEEQEPRWKKALTIPNSMLGEAVGELYVQKYFPEENKKYMERLVENLRNALSSHISGLSWMSDATKEKALDKLRKLTVKIGYPDKWKDYSEIHIDPELTYLENVNRASKWFIADNYSKLGKPVDKDEWFMTPQTVNAYYSPLNNEICFPAGILQPPYFDPDADDAMNYGAIGVVIGHEMTHGFDDQGRQYDADGNLSEWWTSEDKEKFKTLTDKLVKQFDDVEVLPGLHANGKFTLGENIADQGGLRLAWTAYRNTLDESDGEVIDGFTPAQRFYLSYASVWANNIREEEVRAATMSDPHSLGKNRVNVTLRNIKPFAEAFGLGEGDPLYLPENERVIIW